MKLRPRAWASVAMGHPDAGRWVSRDWLRAERGLWFMLGVAASSALYLLTLAL